MGARLIVIGSATSENTPQMRLTKDDDFIKAFAPKRADETFGLAGHGCGDLPNRRLGRWMPGYFKSQQLPLTVSQDHKSK